MPEKNLLTVMVSDIHLLTDEYFDYILESLREDSSVEILRLITVSSRDTINTTFNKSNDSLIGYVMDIELSQYLEGPIYEIVTNILEKYVTEYLKIVKIH